VTADCDRLLIMSEESNSHSFSASNRYDLDGKSSTTKDFLSVSQRDNIYNTSTRSLDNINDRIVVTKRIGLGMSEDNDLYSSTASNLDDLEDKETVIVELMNVSEEGKLYSSPAGSVKDLEDRAIVTVEFMEVPDERIMQSSSPSNMVEVEDTSIVKDIFLNVIEETSMTDSYRSESTMTEELLDTYGDGRMYSSIQSSTDDLQDYLAMFDEKLAVGEKSKIEDIIALGQYVDGRGKKYIILEDDVSRKKEEELCSLRKQVENLENDNFHSKNVCKYRGNKKLIVRKT